MLHKLASKTASTYIPSNSFSKLFRCLRLMLKFTSRPII